MKANYKNSWIRGWLPLFTGLSLGISSQALASINCSATNLYYSLSNFVGGPVPPPGSVIGNRVVLVGTTVVENNQIHTAPVTDAPYVCSVNFDGSSKQVLLSKDTPAGNYSVYSINMTVQCPTGVASGAGIGGNVTCTEGTEFAP
jgi:hypothetical protein